MQYQFAYMNYLQEGNGSKIYEQSMFSFLWSKKATFDNGTKKYHTTSIDYNRIESVTHISLRNDVEKNREESGFIEFNSLKIISSVTQKSLWRP